MKKNVTIKETAKHKYALSASLICADVLNLKDEVAKLERAGVDYLHFDVMDNQFVPRFGLHPEILQAIKKVTKIPVGVHLMVDDPEKALEVFAKAGADIIVVHVEATPHLHKIIKLIKGYGVKAGVAINPATSLSVLDYVLGDIDLVMLMAINPGIVGHKLIPETMDKISELHKKVARYPDVLVEIDGGVTPESALEMVKRGANMLVCGTSTIFKPEGDVEVKVKELRKILDKV